MRDGLRKVLIPALLLVAGVAWASEIPVARFSASDLTGWSDKGVKGKTVYSLEDGALKAHSVKGASAKIRKFEADPKKYQRITWRWRVDHTLKREDVKERSGDDFAARVYVVFPRSFFRMRAINYVWAAKMPKDSEVPSPYTSNSVIIAVESGDEKAGRWVSEERNVYEDYKRIFGEEPPPLGGGAIMSDTDDTRDEVTAWYGDITLQTVKNGSSTATAAAGAKGAPAPAAISGAAKGANEPSSAPSPTTARGANAVAATSPPAAKGPSPSSSSASSSASGGATHPPR